jgi:hypothetical protein
MRVLRETLPEAVAGLIVTAFALAVVLGLCAVVVALWRWALE